MKSDDLQGRSELYEQLSRGEKPGQFYRGWDVHLPVPYLEPGIKSSRSLPDILAWEQKVPNFSGNWKSTDQLPRFYTWRMGSQDLEDTWLVTMVSFRCCPLRIGQRGTPSKSPKWLINGGDPNHWI